MANPLPDPGFEEQLWELAPNDTYAEFVTSPVFTGSYALRLRDSNIIGGSGTADSPSFTVPQQGQTRTFAISVYPTTDNSAWSCRFRHYPNGIGFDSAIIATVNASTLNENQWNELEYSITPTGSSDIILIQLTNSGGFGSKDWYFDELYYGDIVAIKLAELTIDAFVTTFQTYLGTELGLIDTDRADGITLAVPANAAYYKRPVPVISGAKGDVQVEIYESEIEFDYPYSDQDAQRATYDIPLTCRLTWFNRDGDTRQTMVTRGRRYATGIFNVISKHPRLGSSDNSIKGCIVNSAPPAWEIINEDEPNRWKGQISLRLTATCEEVH